MNRSKIKTYLLWILLAEAVGGLAGWLIREDVKIYTESIVQPPLSPPALVFPVVWTILYALMGISAARVALTPASQETAPWPVDFWAAAGHEFLLEHALFQVPAVRAGLDLAGRPLGRHPLDDNGLCRDRYRRRTAPDSLPGMGDLCRVPQSGGLDSQLKPKTKPEESERSVQAPPVVCSSAVAGVDVPQLFPGHIGQVIHGVHRGGRPVLHLVPREKAGDMEGDFRADRSQPPGQGLHLLV